MRSGHPCVGMLELSRSGARDGGGRKEDTLESVENIEQECGVERCAEVERHDGME